MEINKENLKLEKLVRQGFHIWIKPLIVTGVTIVVDIKTNPHVSVECGNDSLHIPNCSTMQDIKELIRLFGSYN